MNNIITEETREDFCPACLIVPLAFAGAGATGVGGMVSKKHKKWKKALLISGIATILMSLIFLVYWFMNKDKCSSGTCSL